MAKVDAEERYRRKFVVSFTEEEVEQLLFDAAKSHLRSAGVATPGDVTMSYRITEGTRDSGLYKTGRHRATVEVLEERQS